MDESDNRITEKITFLSEIGYKVDILYCFVGKVTIRMQHNGCEKYWQISKRILTESNNGHVNLILEAIDLLYESFGPESKGDFL